MIKHREAYEALTTIAQYCNERDCQTECIFYKTGNKICCRLYDCKYSPAGFVYDYYEIIPIKERCEKLERQEEKCDT